MAKRPTLGLNPLDAVIPVVHSVAPTEEEKPSSAKMPKERLTVHLPIDLIDRVKNAVFWTPGMTLASFAEDAFSKAMEELEKARGEAFPARKAELKGGRPLK